MCNIINDTTSNAVYYSIMRRIFGLLMALMGALLPCDALAQDAIEDAPPIPFIIGGDDLLSPAENISSVSLPLETAAPIEEHDIASSESDFLPAELIATRESSSPEDLGGAAVLPEVPQALSKEIPVEAHVAETLPLMELAETEAPEAVSEELFEEETPAVAKAQSREILPPLALPELPEIAMPTQPLVKQPMPPLLAKPEGWVELKPAEEPAKAPVEQPYTLEQPQKPLEVVATDGSTQIKGLEHVVGSQNTLLPSVTLTPAVAVVGEGFPELHVDQIPLGDLLSYLKDFSPKTLHNELPKPLYVTVDMKAQSIEEVLGYLMARYPIEVTSDANSIFIRPAVARPIEPLPQNFYAQQPAMPANAMAPLPVNPGYRAPSAALPPPAMLPEAGYAPAGMSVAQSWDDIRLKAKLYELEKRRQKLLAEREQIHSRERSRWMSE